MKTDPTPLQPDIEPSSTVEPSPPVAENPDAETVPESLPTQVKRPLWLWITIALILLGGGIGWRAFRILQGNPSSQETAQTPEAALPVRVVPVKAAPIQEWVFSNGIATSVRFKHLTFEAAGTIDSIKKVNGRELREGDRVRSGDILARLDQRISNADVTVAQVGKDEAQQQVTTAIANLQQYQASLRQAQASLVEAEARLTQAKTDRDFAQDELVSYQSLWEQGIVSENQYKAKKTAFENAQANVQAAAASIKAAQSVVEAARESVRSAQSQVRTAQAGVESANAQVNKAQVTQEYNTVIRAPFNGIIATLNIREGDYWTPQRVNAGADYQTIVEDVPMIVIDPSTFEVNAEFPAFQGAKIRPQNRALIVLDQDQAAASSGQITSDDLIKLAKAKGEVFSVSPSVTPGERAIDVTIRITEGTANLQHGAPVSVWIAVEEKNNATVAPFSAFVFRDQHPHIFVVNEDNGTVEQRQIKLGIEGISMREISQGVKPGQLLVTQGKNRLVDGTPVDIIEVLE